MRYNLFCSAKSKHELQGYRAHSKTYRLKKNRGKILRFKILEMVWFGLVRKSMIHKDCDSQLLCPVRCPLRPRIAQLSEGSK
jgi:hypothetical protein